ncbi:MAG: hypothetical protein ACYCYD_13935, partial [Acidimicrobiales bacterium]
MLVSLAFLVEASGPLAGLTGFAALTVSAAAVAMVPLRGVAAREGRRRSASDSTTDAEKAICPEVGRPWMDRVRTAGGILPDHSGKLRQGGDGVVGGEEVGRIRPTLTIDPRGAQASSLGAV